MKTPKKVWRVITRKLKKVTAKGAAMEESSLNYYTVQNIMQKMTPGLY